MSQLLHTSLRVDVGRKMLESCALLDAEDFDGWLALWAPDGTYEIVSYTPELRRQELLLRLAREDLGTLLGGARQHVRDGSSMFRLCSPPLVDGEADDHGRVAATQNVAIYTTSIAGASQLYCLARYHDVWGEGPEGPALGQRRVELVTREFTIGTHVLL